MMQTPREVALLTLAACDTQGAWSDLTLKKQIRTAQLDSRDAGLATKIAFGVIQNRMLCDFYISAFSSIPLEKMENKVLNALRIAVYQMVFLTKIPPSAAVNESVELVRKHSKNPRSTALVNGILRNLGRNLDALPQVDEGDFAYYLSVQYSHPKWLVERFLEMFGRKETQALLHAHNSEPPTVAQVNTLKTATKDVKEMLDGLGAQAEVHPWLPDCITFTGGGDVEQMSGFQSGELYMQDAGARLAVMAAGVAPGMSVLDVCSAPGGKSFASAIAMKDQGQIVSCDIHPHKIKLIQSGANRLGLSSISARVQDGKACEPDFVESFDVVITDVPCSGLGIIRKKPDIRYKEPKPLENLPKIQSAILENAAQYVKTGGVLLYCTCTILARENRAVVDGFLAGHPNFVLEAFTVPGPVGTAEEGDVTLLPHIHGTDGFYIAKLRNIPSHLE